MNRRCFFRSAAAACVALLAPASALHVNPPGYFIEYYCSSEKRFVRYKGRWKRGDEDHFAFFIDPPPPRGCLMVEYIDETYFHPERFSSLS